MRQAPLEDRVVLWVGGRSASVPLYRHIVELGAADLVICQTGCISHNARWRVKDDCKRTGKHCVFVDNPGSASLKRALSELQHSLPS